ncbi:ABC transporter ATP-binding protein [Defluviimonas sp. 20V17]|uniref:ABC transporter ATP-binding protein n=1 Tax=Allgaiera indica TaxID=765699 RepID=A0AAN5A156_9RHOB|nr:ABC transporter ATP-binding protein [Allgaiera indica]KDB04265.1 ABC transporter ATP-binding protein [Defluviimonas sp. 20V17]GHE03690.1 ABC transporter ATP-binding protein [Allgaiera indica]SDX74413.1 NitT/TauT family transport system ATP-binding protein [Allgaiera indica]
MAAPLMQVDRISKTFALAGGRTLTAVSDVSFTVEKGSICALLGPSGSGKSTILRMIAGLETLTSGTIRLKGQEIDGPGQDRGMVFQAYTSFDWLSVRKNVEFGMRINGVPARERRERAEHFIGLVGLSKFIDSYPSRLSGGMRQRVAIARSLANAPEVLLMDEPFGALDAETRWQMQELMIEVAEASATTVIVVTHDIEEAIFLADKIEFLSSHPGRLREEIIPDFKPAKRIRNKEQLLELDGFAETERKIMRLMREEGQH